MNLAWIVVIVVAVVALILVAHEEIEEGIEKVKYVCSEDYDTQSSERITLSVILGAVLDVIVTIIQLVRRYNFRGILGFIETVFVWWIMCGTIAYMLLCSGKAIRYIRTTPKQKLVPVGLLLPAGVLTAFIASKFITQPLLGWIMSAITRDTWETVPAEGYAMLCGLFMWFYLAKDSEYRKWPKQLAMFAAAGAVGTLIPYGLALILLMVVVAGAFAVYKSATLDKYATPNEAAAIRRKPETEEEWNAQQEANDRWAERAANQTPVTDMDIIFDDFDTKSKDE